MNEKTPVMVRLRPEELHRLDRLAERLMTSRGAAMRYALRELVEQKEKSGAVLVDDPAGAAPRVSLRA